MVYDNDGTDLHGPGGLGGVSFPGVKKHTTVASRQTLVELVREFPRQVTVINLGPLTVLARALDRDPELPSAGRAHRLHSAAPGTNRATLAPSSEFHFACDPAGRPAGAALRCADRADPARRYPQDRGSRRATCWNCRTRIRGPAEFLRQIVPFGIRATSNLYGIEGFHLKDVLGVFALPGRRR